MGALRGYSLGVPTNQTVANNVQFKLVNGVSQKVSSDGKYYKTPQSLNTSVKTMSETSLLTNVLTATGFGALVATVGDVVTDPIVEMYKNRIASFNPQTSNSTLGDLISAITQISNDAIESSYYKPYTPPPQSTLLDILKFHADSASKLANVQEQAYLEMKKKGSDSDAVQATVKTMLEDHVGAVDKLFDNKLLEVKKTITKQYDEQYKSVNDNLLKNNDYIDSLNNTFKDSIDKSFQNNITSLELLTGSMTMVADNISRTNGILVNDGVAIQKTEKDLLLQSHEIEKHEFNKTVQSVNDLDGNKMAEIAPRDLKNIESVSTARKHTDQNNFEVSNDDIDMMHLIPDLSSIFKYDSLTDRISQSLSDMQNS